MMRLAAAVLSVAVALTLAACSQKVYSPPAQTFSVSPIYALAPGQSAVDLEVSSHAEIFDPAVQAFDARYRTGVGANTELSVEGTAHAVDDQGPSMADRTFYSGRAGVRTNPGDGATKRSPASFFAGGGGGYARSGGGFVSVDSGLAVGYENCYVTPVLQASAFVSQPLAARPIDVSRSDQLPPKYDTPATTIGGTVRGGLRISLSPSACRRGEQVPRIMLGAGLTALSDHDSNAGMLGAGLGFELPL